jgi:hypothetical protein
MSSSNEFITKKTFPDAISELYHALSTYKTVTGKQYESELKPEKCFGRTLLA